MRQTTLRRLAPLTGARLGLVTLSDLHRARLDGRLPVREGWPRLAPGLWSTTGSPTDDQLVLVAGLVGGVLTGPLACRRYGLRDAPAEPGVDVLVPHGGRRRGGDLVRVHQTLRLPSTTTAPVARAVADAARRTPSLAGVRALVLAAVADGRLTVDALQQERDAGEARGRAHLTTALRDAVRGARSAPEAEAADALLGLPPGALPAVVLNPSLRLGGRLLGLPDGYLLGSGLGWEVDSVRHHGSAADLAATLDRHAAFADAGVELLHVVPSVLRRDPAGWARSVATRLAQRRAAGRGEPTGLEVVPAGPLIVSADPRAPAQRGADRASRSAGVGRARASTS